MAQLVWGEIGTRFFEAGIDRGVLYLKDGRAVPWNGLISVSESSSGGEAKPFYADGFKYLNLSSAEEFKANISAYSAPLEFAECDGTRSVGNGLFIHQQPRQSFGLSYRTLVGNDTQGLDFGYKIHLIYNALAAPAERKNVSINNAPEAIELSWDISTLAPRVTGYQPSAHFIIDSTKTPADLMTEIESRLYGTSISNGYLMQPSELLELFASYALIEVYTDYEDGRPLELNYIRAHKSATPPVLFPGEERIWLDTSGGDYATLNLVTGD